MSFTTLFDKYNSYYQTLSKDEKYSIENDSDNDIHLNKFARNQKISLEDYNFLLTSKGGWKTSNYDLIQQYVHNVLNQPTEKLKLTKKPNKKLNLKEEEQ